MNPRGNLALWLVSVSAILLLAVFPASAQQVEEVVVVGQVENGTAGYLVSADLTVTLHVFVEGQETRVHTTTLDEDGSFRFDGIALGEGDTLLSRVTYRDVVYTSERLSFEAGRQQLALPVTIYETTDDPQAIVIAQVHTFMVREGDRLEIGEIYLLSNSGDQTYIGQEDARTGQRETVSFALPEGVRAEDVSLGDGSDGRYSWREGSVVDTMPVRPGIGTVEALVGYELPYRDGTRVVRAFDIPVASVLFVLPVDEMALQGDKIIDQGVLDTQMGAALSYSAGPLAAGEVLAFTVVEAASAPSPPSAAESPPVRNQGLETGIGLGMLGVAVILAYLLWRSPARLALPSTVQPLVAAIAELDTEYEGGREQEDYHTKREALVRQIRSALSDRTGD